MAKDYLFTEDDDLDIERENMERDLAETEKAMDMMAHDWPEMAERRRNLRRQLQEKQLDPLVKEALRLAQLAGHALGANEGLSNKLKNMVTRVEVRDEEIKRTADRDSWKKRAEQAEESLAKLRKRRRSR